MIALRLQTLCETKCFDIAKNYAQKALRAIKSCDANHSLKKNTSVRQYAFIFDVYLALLFKYNEINECKNEVSDPFFFYSMAKAHEKL